MGDDAFTSTAASLMSEKLGNTTPLTIFTGEALTTKNFMTDL